MEGFRCSLDVLYSGNKTRSANLQECG